MSVVDARDTTQPDYNVLVKQLCDEIKALKVRTNALEVQTVRGQLGESLNLLPAAASRANRIQAFNSSGDPIAIVGVDSGSAASLAMDLATAGDSSKGAGLVAFIRSLTGSIAYTLFDLLNWSNSSVLEFMTPAQRIDYLSYAGTLDVTIAVQTAETQATAAGKPLIWPAGCALITAQIFRANGSQWLGQRCTKGSVSGNYGTLIKFQPATPQYLWTPSGTPGPFRTGYVTAGFTIQGNSSSSSGNSIGTVNAYGCQDSVFKDLLITNFRCGIRCYSTLNNSFENIKIANTYIASILYDGGICTTDKWDKFYLTNTPDGVLTAGTNVSIRFISGIVESVNRWGFDICRESYGFSIDEVYTEDCNNGGSVDSAVVRVGYSGSASTGNTQVTISNSWLGGINSGSPAGNAIDCDTVDSVVVNSVTAARFALGIRVTGNTNTGQVSICGGFSGISLGAICNDFTKLVGLYPTGTLGSGTRNKQAANLLDLNVDGSVKVASGSSPQAGSIASYGNSIVTTVGAAGAASALPATPEKYLDFYLGATHYKIPLYKP